MLNGTHHSVDTHRYGSFSFASEEEDPFFVTHQKPEGLDIVKTTADAFVRQQKELNRPVVLVTSGGSTVPLEVFAQAIPVPQAFVDVESNGKVY